MSFNRSECVVQYYKLNLDFLPQSDWVFIPYISLFHVPYVLCAVYASGEGGGFKCECPLAIHTYIFAYQLSAEIQRKCTLCIFVHKG